MEIVNASSGTTTIIAAPGQVTEIGHYEDTSLWPSAQSLRADYLLHFFPPSFP